VSNARWVASSCGWHAGAVSGSENKVRKRPEEQDERVDAQRGIAVHVSALAIRFIARARREKAAADSPTSPDEAEALVAGR
jgi:hypothetical protein